MGKVITTADGHNYVHSKMTDDYIYLKCGIFRTDCKETCKLNRIRSLITPMKQYNHSVEDYKADSFRLKTKCKTIAGQFQTNLRKVFDDATRNEPCAADISFVECESSMYRARRTLQPKTTLTANKFFDMLMTSTFADNLKFSVTRGG